MHIFFSGIGGTAIGPLALIAKQAGFTISGSDKQESEYTKYLQNQGLTEFYIGQNRQSIAQVHQRRPIDWYVYSSAVSLEQQDASEEIAFCREHAIKTSKRGALINHILETKNLQMVAVAGTHGKTTTTAMVIWLFKQLGLPVSYSLGAKINFGPMGQYQPGSQYFVYEADEFDRNFLDFQPKLSVITGVSWDHHEIFPTREDYQEAFHEFIAQSDKTILWEDDLNYLKLKSGKQKTALSPNDPVLKKVSLIGHYNRLDAVLAIKTMGLLTNTQVDLRISIINQFPGLQRRMEQIVPNLYSDYAHTPEKIRGAMSVATELAAKAGQKVIIVYEPLTNRRQHYMINEYQDCFRGADKVYWLPSYLAREDPNMRVIPPEELISHLSNPELAKPIMRNDDLKQTIKYHLKAGDMVVCMAGGGGDSLDEWIRKEFKP